MKEDYSKIFDLVNNDSFREFVLNPGAANRMYWEHWIKDHPDKLKEVQFAIDFIRSRHAENIELKSGEMHAELERFIAYIDESPKLTNSNVDHTKKSGVPMRVKRAMVAASVLLISVLFTYLYVFKEPYREPFPAEPIVTQIEKESPKGLKTTFKLPDGSIAKLNADSKLTFPNEFSSASREVVLEGEAFFEVRKDTLKPFIVKTNGLSMHVLGTSFNVKAYVGEDIEVALLTGKVRVSGNSPASESILLLPTEMVIYNSTDGSIEKTTFDPVEKLAWRENTLYFNNSNFDDIIKTLERWYGVSFDVQRPGQIQERFTGVYKDPSLKTVLEGISFSLDFKFEIQHKTVIIK